MSKRPEHASGGHIKTMFSEIPQEVIDESLAAWRASRKQRAVSPDAAPKETRPAQAACETVRTFAPERVCFFAEADLSQPTAVRKKPAPADGVSFF